MVRFISFYQPQPLSLVLINVLEVDIVVTKVDSGCPWYTNISAAVLLQTKKFTRLKEPEGDVEKTIKES